jgi:hypothetical protein
MPDINAGCLSYPFDIAHKECPPQRTMYHSFESLPRRIFLDSCTAQTLRDYGGYICEGEPIPNSDRIRRIPDGIANVEALRNIFLINERALFEWIVSAASMQEAHEKGDPGHFQWLWDIADHSEVCLEGDGPTAGSAALAARLNEPNFGYLSTKDRRLLRQSVFLRCFALLGVVLIIAILPVVFLRKGTASGGGAH